MIFVNSMSDLFHEEGPLDFIQKTFDVMRKADWHQYQILTKRSERLRDMLRAQIQFAAKLPHIWWGVSVENRKHGLPRIEHLQSSPASVRFLSIEPLIEDLGEVNLDGINWVIVGGESGAGARPLKKEWVLSIFRQCREAGVPFFFKQWGGVRKKETGRKLNGRTYDEFPERVESPVVDSDTRLAAIATIESPELAEV